MTTTPAHSHVRWVKINIDKFHPTTIISQPTLFGINNNDTITWWPCLLYSSYVELINSINPEDTLLRGKVLLESTQAAGQHMNNNNNNNNNPSSSLSSSSLKGNDESGKKTTTATTGVALLLGDKIKEFLPSVTQYIENIHDERHICNFYDNFYTITDSFNKYKIATTTTTTTTNGDNNNDGATTTGDAVLFESLYLDAIEDTLMRLQDSVMGFGGGTPNIIDVAQHDEEQSSVVTDITFSLAGGGGVKDSSAVSRASELDVGTKNDKKVMMPSSSSNNDFSLYVNTQTEDMDIKEVTVITPESATTTEGKKNVANSKNQPIQNKPKKRGRGRPRKDSEGSNADANSTTPKATNTNKTLNKATVLTPSVVPSSNGSSYSGGTAVKNGRGRSRKDSEGSNADGNTTIPKATNTNKTLNKATVITPSVVPSSNGSSSNGGTVIKRGRGRPRKDEQPRRPHDAPPQESNNTSTIVKEEEGRRPNKRPLETTTTTSFRSSPSLSLPSQQQQSSSPIKSRDELSVELDDEFVTNAKVAMAGIMGVPVQENDDWLNVWEKMKYTGWTKQHGIGLVPFIFRPPGAIPQCVSQLGNNSKCKDYLTSEYEAKLFAYVHLGWGGDDLFYRQMKEQESLKSGRRGRRTKMVG